MFKKTILSLTVRATNMQDARTLIIGKLEEVMSGEGFEASYDKLEVSTNTEADTNDLIFSATISVAPLGEVFIDETELDTKPQSRIIEPLQASSKVMNPASVVPDIFNSLFRAAANGSTQDRTTPKGGADPGLKDLIKENVTRKNNG